MGDGYASTTSSSTVAIVLATDGVWDNFRYEDVCQFVMDPSCLQACVGGMGAEGARRVTSAFMQRNAILSQRNFGSQADNATAIILYVSRDNSFPSIG